MGKPTQEDFAEAMQPGKDGFGLTKPDSQAQSLRTPL
jgi:hypothetical protein